MMLYLHILLEAFFRLYERFHLLQRDLDVMLTKIIK
jgi:hypothetical protein